jgi:hypothetical protein
MFLRLLPFKRIENQKDYDTILWRIPPDPDKKKDAVILNVAKMDWTATVYVTRLVYWRYKRVIY